MVAVAAADQRPTYSYAPPEDSGSNSYESIEYDDAKYDFDWSVKDGYSRNDFGHQESRDGDFTEGSYYVQLPDGRLQTVKYYVDGDSGFVAEVNYEGEAHYDSVESYEAPRPRYSAPESPEESVEVPVYVAPRPVYRAPRPTYVAPESSEESVEVPVYTPPRPTYAPPRPSYGPPRRSYGVPQ